MGRTVVLEIGDIEIVISETAALVHDLSPYRSVGLEPTEAKIVVVKSPLHFRAAYGPIAKEIIPVDAPGSTAFYGQSFANLFKGRHLFPLDETVSFKA
jgi:microcystin degradation protein MlrC